MKKLLLLAFLLAGIQAHSQILISLLLGDKLNSDGLEFGLEGGFNFSDIGTLEADKRLSTFNLGFYFDIRLKNQWSLFTGVLVKSKYGADELSMADLDFLGIEPYEEDGTYTQKVNSFMIPALFRYNFENRIYLEAGPQFSLMYNSFVEFNSDTDERDITIKDYNKDAINKMDAGVAAGAGYRLKKTNGMSLGIRYYYGFVNVYEGVSGSNNNSIFLRFNVPIGAAKKKDCCEKLEEMKEEGLIGEDSKSI